MPIFSFPVPIRNPRYPQEFRACLQTRATQTILARYQKRGGHPGAVRAILWQLREGVDDTYDPHSYDIPRWFEPRRRDFTACLRRCDASISALINLSPLPRTLQWELESWHREVSCWLEGIENTRSPRRGRRSGPTLNSVVPAILACAFEYVFDSPRYQDILTLVQAVAPEKFPPSVTQEHIRQRVLGVPKAYVEDYLERIVPVAPAPERRKSYRR